MFLLTERKHGTNPSGGNVSICTGKNARDSFARSNCRAAAFQLVAKASAWNTIIVGSSPLLLMEAIHLSQLGRKVLVLEEKDQLGGVWGGLHNKEFPYLDIGCHYWDISRRAYEFLRSNFRLNLEPFHPQPQFAYRNILFPYDYKQAIRIFRDLKKVVRRRSFGSFVSNMILEEYHRPRLFPFTKKFLFPRGGSHELMTRLISHMQETDITMRKRTFVESIRFNVDQKQVEVGAGRESFLGDEVVTGSQARISDALNITPESIGTLRRIHTHVNLIVRDSSVPSFSYIRFIRHHAVNRMTDITGHLRHWNADIPSRRVICIGIHDAYDKSVDDAEKIKQLVALLKEYRLVDPSAEVEGSYWNRYPVELLSDETRERLRREFSPMIRLFETTNFSMGVASNVSRWDLASGGAAKVSGKDGRHPP